MSFLNNYRTESSVAEMLTDLQWILLEERRQNARLNMLNKVIGGKMAINIKPNKLTPGHRQSIVSN